MKILSEILSESWGICKAVLQGSLPPSPSPSSPQRSPVVNVRWLRAIVIAVPFVLSALWLLESLWAERELRQDIEQMHEKVVQLEWQLQQLIRAANEKQLFFTTRINELHQDLARYRRRQQTAHGPPAALPQSHRQESADVGQPPFPHAPPPSAPTTAPTVQWIFLVCPTWRHVTQRLDLTRFLAGFQLAQYRHGVRRADDAEREGHPPHMLRLHLIVAEAVAPPSAADRTRVEQWVSEMGLGSDNWDHVTLAMPAEGLTAPPHFVRGEGGSGGVPVGWSVQLRLWNKGVERLRERIAEERDEAKRTQMDGGWVMFVEPSTAISPELFDDLYEESLQRLLIPAPSSSANASNETLSPWLDPPHGGLLWPVAFVGATADQCLPHDGAINTDHFTSSTFRGLSEKHQHRLPPADNMTFDFTEDGVASSLPEGELPLPLIKVDAVSFALPVGAFVRRPDLGFLPSLAPLEAEGTLLRKAGVGPSTLKKLGRDCNEVRVWRVATDIRWPNVDPPEDFDRYFDV